jgi:hypothetical protein
MGTVQLTKPREKRATIYEVARLAKVSHVTVTRAFSNEASGEIRKKVLAVATENVVKATEKPVFNPLEKRAVGIAVPNSGIRWKTMLAGGDPSVEKLIYK